MMMIEKRPQLERLIIADSILCGVYEEMLNGKADDVLQLAADIQVTVNRIVWLLNKKMQEE